MKRIVALMATVVVGAGLFSACGESESNESRSTGGSAGASGGDSATGGAATGGTATGGATTGGTATGGATTGGATTAGTTTGGGAAGGGGATSSVAGAAGWAVDGGAAGASRGGAGGNAAGMSAVAGAGGASGDGGMGGVVEPACVSPNWIDCPRCTNDEPESGSCTYTWGDSQPCSFGTGTSNGICECVVGDAWYCRQACGTEPPPQGSSCFEIPPPGENECWYGGAVQPCACESPGRWNCGCPQPAPSDGTTCAEYDGMDCDYSYWGVDDRCLCNATSGNWECLSCPVDKPKHDSDCTAFPHYCDYDAMGGSCDCDPLTNVWWCDQRCGTTPPVHGDPCNGDSGWCPSNDEHCICDNATGTWNCVACDVDPPPEGSACTGLGGLVCAHFDARCTCDHTAETWSCEAECPPPVPTDGVACSDPAVGTFCIYPGTPAPTYCVCDGNAMQWRCMDCPASMPTQGNDCSGYYGRSCTYLEGRCTCDTASDTWDCVYCPATAPPDASSCAGMPGLTCSYPNRCTCNRATLLWECN